MLLDAQLSLQLWSHPCVTGCSTITLVVGSSMCYWMLNYHSSCGVMHVLLDAGIPMPGMMWYFSLTHLSTAVVTIFTLG